MPSKRYAVVPGGVERLEVEWTAGWKRLTVRWDGRELGTVAGPKELKAGPEFALEDGATLKVQLFQGFLGTELQLHRDGQPLPGSVSNPAERVRAAAGVTFFMGGLALFLGLLTGLFRIEFLARHGVGWASAASGVLYLFLGYCIQRRSYAALLVAVVLTVLDGLAMLAHAGQTGGSPIGSILVRVYFVARMVKGLEAIRFLKQQETAPDAAALI